MSIRNYIRGDDNTSLILFCNHFNCGDVDIQNNIIKNVQKMNTIDLTSNKIYIKNIDIEQYILSLRSNLNHNIDKTNIMYDNKIPYLENKVIELQNQIIELQKVIKELTNINLIN